MTKLDDSAYSLFYHSEQLKAASAKLYDTPDYFYRKVCRWYAHYLNTPLKEVRDLPYHEVLREYYENSMEKMSYNEVFDYTKTELLDTFVTKDEEDNKEFALELEREQAQTIKKKEAKKAKEAAQQQAIEDERLLEEQRQSLNRVEIPDIDQNFGDSED